MTLHIEIQFRRILRILPRIFIWRGEHPDLAFWRDEHPAVDFWRTRCQDFERLADSFAARLERQPARDAGGRYCKR